MSTDNSPGDEPVTAAGNQHARPATRATLKSVARALGVSTTTVSNAFSRPDQLSSALRQKILRESRALGYYGPDPIGRALRSRELREVGVVFHHDLSYALNDQQTVEFLRGVAIELDSHQLMMQIIPKMGRRMSLQAAFQTTADMMIVHTDIGPEFVPELQSANKPFVLVDVSLPGLPCVGIRDRDGALLAMAHALSKKPQKVILLGFQMDPAEKEFLTRDPNPPFRHSVVADRAAGYLAAVRAARFSFDDLIWVEIDAHYPESTARHLAQIRQSDLQRGERVAIVAMSDRLALDALRSARQWNDIELISVVGFDDIPAAAEAGLTTIRQNVFEKGRLAARVLLEGEPAVRLPVELVVRDT